MEEDLIGLPICTKCGEQHVAQNGTASCKAHNSRGKPCHSYPVPAGTVCIRHGGRTQQRGAVVRDELARREMEYAANMLGLVDYDITPEEALLQTVREAAANVAFLRARVQALVGEADLDDPNHPLIWGTTRLTSVGASPTPGDDEEQGAGVHIWYKLYQEERQHLFQASQAAVRAGIAERRVRLAEMSADVIVGRIRQILNALNLTPQQLLEADRVVPMQISMLAADLEAQQT